MLFNLSIENVALIEKADINFEDGFNVLTGETGAGKSILISSLNLLLGERGTKEMIRHGENYAYVEGLFYLDEDAKKELLSYDIETDEDRSLIISRKLSLDGKNLCKAGGKTVSVATLREIGRNLINIHGQHDNQALLDEKCHITFLDAFSFKDTDELSVQYKDLYKELLSVKSELSLFDIDENEKARKIDLLQFEIDEITSAAITIGEEDELKAKRNIMKNKEEYIKNSSVALSMLYENDEMNAYSLASQALKYIDKIGDNATASLSEKMNDILYSIEDVASDIRSNLDRISQDDISFDEIEERLDTIYRLKRKFGSSEEIILSYCENAQKELDKIRFSDERKKELQRKIEDLSKETLKVAETLSAARKEKSRVIETKINEELAELNMEGASFKVDFTKTELCKNGIDKVEFLISANRGEPEKPLSRIVSGGELSRIMLAMKNVLADGDVAKTLIFDEIDTGISGVTAGKVGAKLSEISRKKQVVCVTHLPQIAALSDSHFKIEKVSDERRTSTHIRPLSEDEKILQIAYMISGDEKSKTSRAQAEEMINRK